MSWLGFIGKKLVLTGQINAAKNGLKKSVAHLLSPKEVDLKNGN